MDTVREEGAVLGEECICCDLSPSPSADGHDRNGSELGRPWDRTPKAWVFHVTLCLIPLHMHGEMVEM